MIISLACSLFVILNCVSFQILVTSKVDDKLSTWFVELVGINVMDDVPG